MAKKRRRASTPEIPVVGIGASAGGLKALDTLFSKMPANSGAAYVVVTHLDPNRKSLLPEILNNSTSMTVVEIKEGMRLQPNVVFICPPKQYLKIVGGVFSLPDQSAEPNQMVIDNFFASLAADQQFRAIAIVLSGSGADGSTGIEIIKQNSGSVVAQSPETAEFKGMPESAIASGVVDQILPPEKMPDELGRMFQYARGEKSLLGEGSRLLDDMSRVFGILRLHTGHDFEQYKTNTIARRIARRMSVRQIESLSEYVSFLGDNQHETKLLFKEFLIGVTSFFRDTEAFEFLSNEGVPDLLETRKTEGPVRVWVPGCATGEEAYSLAIVIHECINKMKWHHSVQIFGTDIDESAIAIARAGRYPASIEDEVTPERLERYFRKEEDGSYVVKSLIRDMLVFAPQNLTDDPPFTKLDILSCRNLLIYLQPKLQSRIMPLFHYSLRPGGLLFLGSSETVGQFSDLFEPLTRVGKVFRSIAQKTAPSSFHFSQPPAEKQMSETPRDDSGQPIDPTFYMEAILGQADSPPCVIIDEKKDVVYIHGDLDKYLHASVGKASLNILRMVNPGLQADLSSAIRKSGTSKDIVETDSVREDGEDQFDVRLKVEPFVASGAGHDFMMIHFDDIDADRKKAKRPRPNPSDKTVNQLEKELRNTKETLQTLVEELQTSNEEMKSTNEELQSTNEELQSSNEELETSKEELQSLNEESDTVNSDLQSRIGAMSKMNDDMKNLLDSTNIAAVFLDMDFRIRNYTPRVTDLISLEPADKGRLINSFAINLVGDVDLEKASAEVLEDLVVREKIVKSTDGLDYLMRVRPYRTVTNLIDGVVFTFEDISKVKKAEEIVAGSQVRKSENRLASVLAASKDGIVYSDHQGKIQSVNKAVCKFLGYTGEELVGRSVVDITHENSLAETVVHLRKGETDEERLVPVILEKSYRTKDGGEFRARTTVTYHESVEKTESFYHIVFIQPIGD